MGANANALIHTAIGDVDRRTLKIIEGVMPEFYELVRRVAKMLIGVGTSACLVVSLASHANPESSAAISDPSTQELAELQQRATNGSKQAQYNLSLRYAEGDGVGRDPQAKIALLKESATSGYAPAQNSLGWVYREGLGRPKDLERAIRWFRLAALQGSALALENLGEMYESGEGLDHNDSVAFSFYTLCAARDVESDSQMRDVEAGTATAVLSCRLRLARRLVTSAVNDNDPSSLAFASAWLETGLAEIAKLPDASEDGRRTTQITSQAKALLERLRARMSPQAVAIQKRLMATWKPLMRDLVDTTAYPSILSMTNDD